MGDTQPGKIAKEDRVCMSVKVGISGKAGMSDQAGKSSVIRIPRPFANKYDDY